MTKTRSPETVEEIAFAEAIEKAGGAAALGRALGITGQAISGRKTAPPLRVPKIEEVTGVSRHRLCPEVFGPEPTPESPPEPDAEQSQVHRAP